MNGAGLTHTETGVNNTGRAILSEYGSQAGAVKTIFINKSKGRVK